MDEQAAPRGVDITVPNVARMYDYYLGGKDHFEVDRLAAARVLEVAPQAPALAKENRAFLGRAVRALVAAGVRQFVDIGAGLPTRGNVHQVAQAAAPDARVVYIDYDPVVLAHGRALLMNADGVEVVEGDLRKPDEILADLREHTAIDFGEPVALLLISVLHCLTDADDPWTSVRTISEALPSGSHLAVSHITAGDHAAAARAGASVYQRASTEMTLRSREDILPFFEGFDLLDPGLVRLTEWRPDAADTRQDLPTWFLCGVARKP